MSREAYIGDGYTEDGYIKEEPLLYGEVRFKYRPAMPEERSAIMERIDKAKDGPHSHRIAAAELKKHLASWDLDKPNPKFKSEEQTPDESPRVALEITAANILGLRFKLYDRLMGIVIYGLEGGDVDPEAKNDAKQAAEDDAHLESALSGRTFRATASEADEGN